MENQVIKYNVNEAEIAKMSDIYMQLTVDGIEDTEGMAAVHSAKMVLVKHRTAITKLRLSTNATAQAFIKTNNTNAKKLIDLMAPIEDFLKGEESKVIDELERIKKEKEAKEKIIIQRRVDALFAVNVVLPFFDVACMTDDEYELKLDAGRAELERVRREQEHQIEINRLEEEDRKAEDERLRKVGEEQAKEAERLADKKAALQAEKDKMADEKKAEQERKDREKFEKEAAEKAKSKAEAEGKERAEREAREKKMQEEAAVAEKARIEELAPDKKKIERWIDDILSIPMPDLKRSCNMTGERMETGIYDIPFKQYLDIDRVSCSYLKKLSVVPAMAKIETPETPAMSFGTAFHTYILEKDKFNDDIGVSQKIDKRTTKGKETYAKFAAENLGKTIISAEDFGLIQSMGLSVDRHPMASALLEKGVAEQSLMWTDDNTGIKCKARLDFKTPETIVDIKTTRDASEHGFLRSIVNFRYYQQAGMYLDAINIVSDEEYTDFVFIAVEGKPPFRVEVYSLSDEFLEYGYNEYKRLLLLEKDCREDNFYSHYQHSGRIELTKPRYL